MHNDAQSRDGERQRAPRLTNKRKYFAHLAGSKIASHPVATRLTARVRQHVRNSMRTTASGMRPGQATKKMPARDPRRRFRFEKYTFERLHPAFAATLRAADDRFRKKIHPEELILAQKPRYPHRGRLSWKRFQITRAREQGFLFEPISQFETDLQTRAVSVGRLGFCTRIPPLDVHVFRDSSAFAPRATSKALHSMSSPLKANSRTASGDKTPPKRQGSENDPHTHSERKLPQRANASS